MHTLFQPRTILKISIQLFLTWNCANAQGTHDNNERAKVPQVKVFDNFIGQGYKTATDAAILNSKKGVLIVLLSTPTDTKLYDDVIDIADTEAAFGRTRMVIILADTLPDSIGHHVRLFANGKPQYIFFELSGNRGLGSGVVFSQDLRKVYDACIKPLEQTVQD